MIVKLDKVTGHELEYGVWTGQIVRCALVMFEQSDVTAGSVPDADNATAVLALVGSSLPARGSSYPVTGYDAWRLKRFRVSALNSIHFIVQMFYVWDGTRVVRDSSTLQMVNSQIHPKDHKPINVTWTSPATAYNPHPVTTTKLGSVKVPLPLRNLTIQETVDYQYSNSYPETLGSVNDATWYNYPIGYWMVTYIDGVTSDDGLTYTYTATLTTKMFEDWSEVVFIADDRGRAINIPEDSVKALRDKPYEYGRDTSVNGLTKVGMFPTTNFTSLFGAY